MGHQFISEAVDVGANPTTVSCQKFLGIKLTGADAVTVQINDASGVEIFKATGAATGGWYWAQFPIDTGPSGQIYVAGTTDATVFVSR